MPAFAYGLAQEIAATTTSGSTQIEAGAVNFRVFAHSASSSSVVVYIKTGATAPTATAAGKQRSRVVVWSGGANVLNVNTSARTITTVTPHGSNAVTPGANPGSGVGTGKRFIYLPPPYDVYLLARTAADGIQIYKPID